MRTRSSTDAPLVPYQYTYTQYAGVYGDPWKLGPDSGVITGYFAPESTVKSMNDVVTPKFKRRIAQGEIINNPMNGQTTVTLEDAGPLVIEEVASSIQSGQTVYSGRRISGEFPAHYLLQGTYLAPPVVDPQRIIDIAVTNAYAKADLSEAEILATLAEGKETVYSVISILYRVVRIVNNLRKFEVKTLLKEISPRELQDRYMEARYAIRPLVIDAEKIWTTANMARPLKGRRTARGYMTETASATRSGYSSSYSTWDIVSHQTSVRCVTARAGVMSQIFGDNPLFVWGFDRGLETLWEIIPFSFIVDWFFNVAKTIAAWTPSGGLRQLASWVTVEDSVTQISTVDSVTPWLNSVYYNGKTVVERLGSYTGSITSVVTTKYRLVNPRLAVWPNFNVKLDMAKLLDLAIILKQFLNR